MNLRKLRELMQTPISEEDDDKVFERISDRTGIPVRPPQSTACATCPFRLCNANVDTLYAPAETLAEVWEGRKLQGVPLRPNGGVRDGARMLCHGATDARRATWLTDVSEYRPCVGALVVQQREAIRYRERGRSALTETAVRRVARQMFTYGMTHLLRLSRGVVLAAAHPAIADPAIGHPDLEPPQPGEFE